MPSILRRNKVPKRNTWNAESVFASQGSWSTELEAVLKEIETIRGYQGKLGSSPSVLLTALKARDDLFTRAQRVYVYASFSHAVDQGDQKAAAMQGRAASMEGQVAAALSYFAPELISIGQDRLRAWMQQDSELAIYAHSFDDLFRRQAHVRSGEVEELLGMLVDPFEGPSTTAGVLTNADFKFTPATSSAGRRVEVTQGTLNRLLRGPDRPARQSGWNNYMDRHVEFRNTLTSNLVTSIKANVFRATARKHDSTLAASLFDNNIPAEVFDNLLKTFKQHLPVWHRYFDLRRRALGLRDLAYFDMWAPLTRTKPKLSFDQAVGMITAGLAPMGREYTETLRKGCLEQRWIDWVPNKGKYNGAFSYGAPGTHPFIMMSFLGDVVSMSTLAHELGHSMHSYYTWKHQPLVYADYSLFVAEVASNFHQAMVRGYLLKSTTSTAFQIAVLTEAMDNFFRYFFQMPTLARFELETHQRIEKGQALTADDMTGLMADLFAEAFGSKVKLDRPRVGMVWATFGHLFADYYVYQYATGISGAHALSGRILRGEKGAVDDYLSFIKAGQSVYPLEALRTAGVDLASPKPVEETFDVMQEYIQRLEELLN